MSASAHQTAAQAAIDQQFKELSEASKMALAQALAGLATQQGRPSPTAAAAQEAEPTAATAAPDPTVPVGAHPIGVAIDAINQRAYVANFGANTVTVLDTSTPTPTFVATITGFSSPFGVAILPDGLHAYVTNLGAGTISVVDTTTNAIVGSPITVGAAPRGVRILPALNRAYVANSGADSVSVINTNTNAVITAVPLPAGSGPNELAISPNGTQVYVANFGNGTVSVIDVATNTAFPGTTAAPGAAAVAFHPNPAANRAYVTSLTNVLVLNTAVTPPTVVTPIGGFSNAGGVVVSQDGLDAFVANAGNNTVGVIDTTTNTLLAPPLTVGNAPFGEAITPDGNYLYVTNQNDGTLSVVQIRPIVSAIAPSSGPQSGGTPIHIFGSGFTNATSANLGGSPVTGFTVVNDSDISGTTTAHAAGTVQATVFTPLGSGTGGSFDYLPPAPSITQITPNQGPASVSTTVVITGSQFTGTTSVTVDGSPVPFTVDSDTQITSTLPPHAAGSVTVMVTTPGGSANVGFTYLAAHATSLTATPALSKLFPPHVYFPSLTATLTDQVTGLPVPGQTITFTTGSHTLGTATTDAQGTAQVSEVLTLSLILANGGYDATFAGTPTLLSSSAHAGIVEP
ncbi:IPT/TIG domain-containing protein [Streptomyces sp. NPDC054765]